MVVGFCVFFYAFTAGAADPTLEGQVKALFKAKCASCHGPGGTAERKFGAITDLNNLLKNKGLVEPGDPQHSRLFERISSQDDPMPPEFSNIAPLTAEEKELVKKWIESLDRNSPSVTGFTEKRALDAVSDDLKKLSSRDRKFMRYFNLGTIANKGVEEAELSHQRNALSKVVNSLSWNSQIVKPQSIDSSNLVYRVDLRELKWDAKTWDLIQDANPFKATMQDHSQAGFFQEAMGTALPMVRADWFNANAVRGADPTDVTGKTDGLYIKILQLPKTQKELEKALFVKLEENIANDDVIRSGFTKSGVSKFNRVIERHDSPYGAYWISYDFNSNSGAQDVLTRPLDFQRAGGEIIFHLPNGMLGYMIVDDKGNRINKAPVQVVSDPTRPDQAVETGVSCMRCHAQGFLNTRDQVAAHVDRNRGAFGAEDLEKIHALYVPKEQFNAQINEDNARLGTTLKSLKIDDLKDDPVSHVVGHFETDLDQNAAAAELDVSVEELLELIEKNQEALREFGVFSSGISCSRDKFTDSFNQAVALKGFSGSTATGTNSVGMRFISITPGKFDMGSPTKEPGRNSDESQHSVTLNKGFEMAQTAVTQLQWVKIMGTNPSRFSKKEDCPENFTTVNGVGVCPNRPVEQVSWSDAKKFIKKLNETQRDGYKYRLPTEQEWEFAARAGTKTSYYFGDDPSKLKDFAWFSDNSGGHTRDVADPTHRVNQFGLSDMHGNVWQWVLDNYDSNYSGAASQDKAQEAQQSNSDAFRVMRGGSWNFNAQFLRSAFRSYGNPVNRYSDVGFRLVRTR